MSPRRHPVAKRSLISQIFEKMMNFQKNLVFFENFWELILTLAKPVSIRFPEPIPLLL